MGQIKIAAIARAKDRNTAHRHRLKGASLATHQPSDHIFAPTAGGGEQQATCITAHEHYLGSSHMPGYRRAAGFKVLIAS
jgi:hypothetical protein